jgi:hypothetical protein
VDAAAGCEEGHGVPRGKQHACGAASPGAPAWGDGGAPSAGRGCSWSVCSPRFGDAAACFHWCRFWRCFLVRQAAAASQEAHGWPGWALEPRPRTRRRRRRSECAVL